VDVTNPGFPILQAASRILNDRRPNNHIPKSASLAIDELAVVVALELVGVNGDLTGMK